MIDNALYHHTPEGTTLVLIPAGIVPRLGAWLIDLMVRLVIMLIVAVLTGLLYRTGKGIYLIIFFVVEWFYPVLFEVYRQGQTIGKKYFGIKVCQLDGMAIGWRSSMIRNLLRVADFAPMMFVSAAISMLFSTKNQRIGDMVAGTMVVYVVHEKTTSDIAPQKARTPTLPLLFDEQQAILTFAERGDELPIQRKLELAQILSPVTGKTDAHRVCDELLGFANSIIGR